MYFIKYKMYFIKCGEKNQYFSRVLVKKISILHEALVKNTDFFHCKCLMIWFLPKKKNI